MDKHEVLFKLKEMFDESSKKEKTDYTIENRSLDQTTYVTLDPLDMEKPIRTDPDYEAFITILKYQNTKDCNKVINILTNKQHKIFVEFSDAERTKFLKEMGEYSSKLRSANAKTLPIIEYTLIDWAQNI